MQFIFKDQITDKLLFVIQRFELALKRTSDVADCDDLLRTPEGVDLFDATCMRKQTIGEALKQKGEVASLLSGNSLTQDFCHAKYYFS